MACLRRRCQLVSCLDYPKDPLVLSLRSQPREKPGSPRVERGLLAVRRRQTKLSSGSTVSLAAPRLIPLVLAGLDRRPTARVSSPGGDGWRLRAGCGGAPAEMSWIPPAAPQRSIRSARRNVTATILLATLGAPLVRLDFLLSVISGSRIEYHARHWQRGPRMHPASPVCGGFALLGRNLSRIRRFSASIAAASM